MLSRDLYASASILAVFCFSSLPASADEQERLAQIVKGVVRPIMETHTVPGMAVGISINGRRYFFSYGVASKFSGQQVTEDTMFEIGSISKTFTATLAAYAQVTGSLALSDKASKYLPALAGSSFDEISLLALATHTAGGAYPCSFPTTSATRQR